MSLQRPVIVHWMHIQDIKAFYSPLSARSGCRQNRKNLSPDRRQQVQGKKLRFLCGVSHLSSYSDFNSSRVPLISAGGPSRNSSASMCDTLKPNPLRSDEFSREWELMEDSSPASLSSFYSWVGWNWRSSKKLWWDSRCQYSQHINLVSLEWLLITFLTTSCVCNNWMIPFIWSQR